MKGNAVVTFGFRPRLAVRAGLAGTRMKGESVASTDNWREPKRRCVSGRIVFMPQLERREARRSPPLANECSFLAVRGEAGASAATASVQRCRTASPKRN